MKLLRRLLFPLYASHRHGFLLTRWWFRLALVIYTPLILLWVSLDLDV